MRYYIIAGEPSGDLHGSNLLRGLKREDPQGEFRFWGGDRMAEVGGKENLAKHYRETSFFGIAQVLKNLKKIFGQMAECRRDIASFRPDVVILIDYPSFNMQIAKWAKKHGFRVYYYIAPKVWAWKEWRVRGIRKYVDRVYTIFPFETEYFRKKGIEVCFEGNPLMDSISSTKDAMPSKEEFLKANGLDSRPLVALLAGSRIGEIRKNLPDMAHIAERFPDYQFVVTGVDWLPEEEYRRLLDGTGIRLVMDLTYETLSVATAAIVTSGTATLETALFRVPELVIYRIHPFVEFMRPFVLKIKYISLVNINLDRECVKEIVTSRFDVGMAERELSAILPGGEKREKMLEDFDLLAKMMGEKGSSYRVAANIIQSLR